MSIVSRKAQTTRATVRGIVIEGAAQIIFVDTPGLFAPKRRLDRAMVASAWGAAARRRRAGAADRRAPGDAAARRGATHLTEADAGDRSKHLARAKRSRRSWSLNKIDLVERPKLLALARAASTRRCRSTRPS